MSTRQQFKTVNVLRVRVEDSWGVAGLPNIVPNPSGEYGAWGWRHKGVGSVFATIAGPAFRLTRGTPSASLSTDLIQLGPVFNTPVRWVKAAVTRTGGNVGMQARIDFYGKDGLLISGGTLSASQTTNGTISLAAIQAPTLAKYAGITILHNGTTAGQTIEFNGAAMVTGTQAEVNAATILVEPSWISILNPSTDIAIKREGLNLGTLGMVVRDSTLDPATTSTIRKGKRIEVAALNATSGLWDLIFTGKIETSNVTYDLQYPVVSKRSRIELTAVDRAAVLSQAPRPNSVYLIADLPDVLDSTGVPWNVNGSTNPVFPVTPVAIDPKASALTQVALTRDSVNGYAWVSRKGILNAWDRGSIPTTPTATYTEADYNSDIQIGFDPADVINSVKIICLHRDATGETVETTFGPYVDEFSGREWGKYHKDFTVIGLLIASAAEAFATTVFSVNATPRVRVAALTLPVTDTAHIASRALVDLYDPIRITNTTKGIDQTLRPTVIEHRITPDKWLVKVEFSELAGVASPTPISRRTTFRPPKTSAYSVLTPTNGWVIVGGAQPPARVQLDKGIVYVNAGVKNGTSGASAFTLPVGCRPLYTITVPGADGSWEITPAGLCIPYVTSTALARMSATFPAEQ